MTTKKEIPSDWWNHGINPILGYKYEKPSRKGLRVRSKYEYPEKDNYIPKD